MDHDPCKRGDLSGEYPMDSGFIRPDKPGMTIDTDTDRRLGVIGALAFAGDLSMGQPTDHSPRCALLAHRILRAAGIADGEATTVRLALLRWSGCTANAAEFDDLFGDDVAGRAALLSGQNPFMNDRRPGPEAGPVIRTLSRMHCDTGIAMIDRIGVADTALRTAFAQLFETWDGSGLPLGLSGEDILPPVQAVSLASDLEVWSRVHGLPKALGMLEAAAGARHDPTLVAFVLRKAPDWLAGLADSAPWDEARDLTDLPRHADLDVDEAATLLGDYADLKLPELNRPGRRAATLLRDTGADPVTIRAGRLHGLGWISVPNRVAVSFDPNTSFDEACRLVPHWTTRCLSRLPATQNEAQRAGRAYECADGQGFPNGLRRSDISAEDALLQVAVAVARYGTETASALVDRGALCPNAARRVLKTGRQTPHPPQFDGLLSPREREILAVLSQGLSNKEIARALTISPSTVGTHVENLYRKLGVSNRATATLKALDLGLLQ